MKVSFSLVTLSLYVPVFSNTLPIFKKEEKTSDGGITFNICSKVIFYSSRNESIKFVFIESVCSVYSHFLGIYEAISAHTNIYISLEHITK